MSVLPLHFTNPQIGDFEQQERDDIACPVPELKISDSSHDNSDCNLFKTFVNQHQPSPSLHTETSNNVNNLKQCRICLQNQRQSSKKIVNLCRCMGSVEHVHQECFKEWVQKSLKLKTQAQAKAIIKSRQIECQMCKQQIKLKLSERCKCADYQNITDRIWHNPKKFGLMITSLILSFIGVLYISARIGSNKQLLTRQSNHTQALIMVCMLVMLITVSILLVIFLLDSYFLTRALTIQSVKKSKSCLKNRRRRRESQTMLERTITNQYLMKQKSSSNSSHFSPMRKGSDASVLLKSPSLNLSTKITKISQQPQLQNIANQRENRLEWAQFREFSTSN